MDCPILSFFLPSLGLFVACIEQRSINSMFNVETTSRACSRSAKLMRASLCFRSIAAFNIHSRLQTYELILTSSLSFWWNLNYKIC